MKRKIWVALAATVALLAVPSAAHAEYYMSKRQAQAAARDYVREKYDAVGPVAACRPQGLDAPEPGYDYHRWVCGWADRDFCHGQVRIIGSRGRGYYYGRTLRGMRCD